MKLIKDQLLQELTELSNHNTLSAEKFRTLSGAELNFRESPLKWSILECIEHLNRYGDYYLPEIEKQLLLSSKSKVGSYSPGLFGNYFARLMKTDNGKITKMKSPLDKNPIGSELTVTTIERFLKQQERLQNLLQLASEYDLGAVRVPISISKFIRLKLGDTFRFYIFHIERHIKQADRVLERQAL